MAEGRVARDSHLPVPDGHTSSDGAQDTIGRPMVTGNTNNIYFRYLESMVLRLPVCNQPLLNSFVKCMRHIRDST